MVFNPPTQVNFASAELYSFERRKIQQYNYFLRFRPEILSHTYIEISYNRDLTDNRHIPWHRKIKFVVRTRKAFCSQTTCQSYYPRGQTCTPNTKPRVFKTGDHDVEACQFGCFDLFERTTVPPSSSSSPSSLSSAAVEQYVRGPFLMYSHRQCACTIHDNGMFALGTDDYARTDNHPMPRIDTIGTGFHYVDSGNFFDRADFKPDENKPYIDMNGDESYRFRLNKYYCDDFQLKFDGSKCYESAGEKVFGFLVSSTLYKACQYGVRYIGTGVTNTDVQKLELPPMRYQPRHLTIESWKNDVDDTAFFIDPNVSLLDLGFESEDMLHCIFTTQYGYPGKLIQPKESPQPHYVETIDYAALNKDRLHQFQYDPMTGQRHIDEYEVWGIYQYIKQQPTNFDPSSYNNPSNKLVSFFKGLSENLGETAAIFTISYLLDKGTKYSAKLLTLSAEYLEGVITPTLLFIVERQLLTQSLHPSIRIFSQTIAKLARFSTGLIKMLDVFSLVGGLLDIVDLGVDFFDMKRVMDDGTVQQYSELDIMGMRKNYGYGTVEFSAVTFMITCEQLGLHKKWKQTPAATMKLRCIKDYKSYKYMIPVDAVVRYDDDNANAFEWVSEYIFSLKTNSNGLQINWDDENKLASDVIEQYVKIDNSVYLQGMDEYAKYTETFRQRVKYTKYTLSILIVIFLIVLFVYIKLAILVIFIAALIALYIVFSYMQK